MKAINWIAPVCGVLISTPVAAAADDETAALRQQLLDLQQQMQQMQHSYGARIETLAQRLADLETQPAPIAAAPAPAVPTAVTQDGGSKLQIGLTGLFAAGGSSVDNATLEGLQAGGHDPNVNGFTVQNVELSLGGTVDPYLDAQANLIFQIDAAGDTVVELEEVYFVTRSLPWGLQFKGGQFFTEFGRQNAQHPHTWAFADQPVVLSRFFGGDGLRSQGMRASWLMPTDWYSEWQFGVQNAKGETATSFLNAAGEDVGGHTLIDRQARDIGDLLYSARWLNGLDLSDTVSMNVGLSGLWGPNASGSDTRTSIYGADLYMKWQPERNQRGFPFVTWHSEVLKRRYAALDQNDPGHETLKDWGLFTQTQWGFTPGWVAGLRWEYATADGDTASDPLRDNRKRLSTNLTWFPTEYSKLRLQYNRDWAQHLPDRSADSLWLQVEFSLGRHAAHAF